MRFLFIFLIAITFISCKNEVKENVILKRVNLLLPTSVPVSQLFVFDTTIINWQNSLKSSNIIKQVFEKYNKLQLNVFDPNTDDSILTKYNNEQVNNNLGVNSVLFNCNEIKGLFFKEEWLVDTANTIVFEKKVVSWSPVRYFKRNNEELKKLVFKISGNEASELLAKNVIYEFNLEDTINPYFVKNIDVLRLSNLIISEAVSGKIKAFNPSNIDEEFSKLQIKQKLGENTDTIITENLVTFETSKQIIKSEINPYEIKSLIFIEDWYYNPKTFAIKKVIKGIAPVRHYFKIDEPVKSVVFVMFLGNEKTKIF